MWAIAALNSSTTKFNHLFNRFANLPVRGKFNGAVGNFNAHMLAYEHIDWPELCKGFVEHLGMVWNPYTTQIEPHDYMAEMLDAVCRYNTVLLGFSRDMCVAKLRLRLRFLRFLRYLRCLSAVCFAAARQQLDVCLRCV
jgi:adenylosuccinate lyase